MGGAAMLAFGVGRSQLWLRLLYWGWVDTKNPNLILLDPHSQNYIREAIVRENGELEYLKIFCLSSSQTKRIYLLSQLAEHNWNLATTAAALNNTLDELVKRLEKVGLGYLINQQVTKRMKS